MPENSEPHQFDFERAIPDTIPRHVLEIKHGEGIHFGAEGFGLLGLGLLSVAVSLLLPLYMGEFGWLCFSIPASCVMLVVLGRHAVARFRRRQTLERGKLYNARVSSLLGNDQLFIDIHNPEISEYADKTYQLGFPEARGKAFIEEFNARGTTVAFDGKQLILPVFEGIRFDIPEDHRLAGVRDTSLDEPSADQKQATVPLQSGGGRLSWDERGLRLHLPDQDPIVVHWDTPFVVHLSVWFLHKRQARLTVSLRARGVESAIASKGVEIAVDLPQEQLDSTIDVLQTEAHLLDRESFQLFWDVLRWYAAMHGDPPVLVDLGRVAKPFPRPMLSHGFRKLTRDVTIAVVLVLGLGVKLFYDNPIPLYKIQCEGGNAERCAQLSYRSFGEESFLFAKKGCELEHVGMCKEATEKLSSGKYLPRDSQEAVIFYEKACTLGAAQACYDGGTVQFEDEPKRAMVMYDRGCSLHHKESCYVLGTALLEKYRRTSKAIAAFSMACNFGDDASCCRIAQLHFKGKGKAPSTASACSILARKYCSELAQEKRQYCSETP